MKRGVLAGASFVLLQVLAAGQTDFDRGGKKITIPNGSNSATASFKNIIKDAKGKGKTIFDFDLAICTANVAHKIKKVTVTHQFTSFQADDNNNDQLDTGETDTNVDPPQTPTRVEDSTTNGIGPNATFDISVMLDQPAPVGGIQVQITGTDISSDAYVFVAPIGGTQLVSIPTGSNDAVLLTENATGCFMTALYVIPPSGTSVDASRTSSSTFPVVSIMPSLVQFSGATVSNGAAIEARIQWDLFSSMSSPQTLVVSPFPPPQVPGMGLSAVTFLAAGVLVAGSVLLSRRP